ncbi:ATP-binding protein [Nonomuraea sp. NPDC050556]|uniref:ATP-binding protein n=1 Tax=Nonomuraea sp. NPDC050556 TaxID=3364369 RepID=UPI0037983494
MTSSLSNDTLSRSYTLSPVAASVPAARAWARRMLVRWEIPHLAERIELLVSELITNAIKHAKTGGAPVALILRFVGETLRLEVHDRDAENRPIQQRPMAEAVGGHGLWLVEAYSDRWGIDLTEYGKAVWVELDDCGAAT